jgi:hypothetical protein
MPLSSDIQNIITIITYSNLSNLTAPTPTLVLPSGLENLYVTTVFNNFNDFGLPTDIQNIVQEALTNSTIIIIPV